MLLRLIVTAFALLVSVLFLPEAGFTEVIQAEVTVEGMSCPFCAFGVEKKLKAVEGVGELRVDMGRSTATLLAAEGKSLDIGQISAAVKASGFTPGALKITAVGTVTSGKGDEDLLLQVRETIQAFHLVNIPDSIRNRLQALARSGTAVRITGEAHVHVDELPGLQPKTVEELDR